MHGELIKFEIVIVKSKKFGITAALTNTWQLRR